MRLARAVACVALLALAACGSPPKERYYTLTPAASAPAPAAGGSAISVAVGPVTLPEVIDQPQMVVQVAANQVAIYEFQRWASPLKSEIARVIAANLAQELGTARVWTYAQTTLANPDYQVLVDIQRFDSVVGEAVTIDALWSIRRATGGAPRTGRSSVRETVSGTGFEALVAAHSRALARVSQDIAGAIRAP
ncbi:MAG TPA: PqiC family protein [Burkholderiales bacterium]|nr:PqiC family protein [Burkholderiales bacterium]